MEISNRLEEKSSKILVNFYQTLCYHALSCNPMTVKFDKHFSCLVTCHVVGMVNFYKCNCNIYLSSPVITNSCTHSLIFIKNTLKVHVKFTLTRFGSQMEPSSGGQQLILAKVYKWFNGASPYSQYCGGIRKPMCVYC